MNFEDELIIESLKRELFFQDKIRCVAEFNSRDSIIKFVKRHAEKIMKILFPGGRVRNSAVRLGSEKEKRYENFQYRAREREKCRVNPMGVIVTRSDTAPPVDFYRPALSARARFQI